MMLAIWIVGSTLVGSTLALAGAIFIADRTVRRRESRVNRERLERYRAIAAEWGVDMAGAWNTPDQIP